MFRILLSCSFIVISFLGHSQSYTGFRQLMEFDSSRTFDTVTTSAMHLRPVKIDLFYPSTASNGAPMHYGDFFDMYSLRMDYTITPDSAKKAGRDIADMFSKYMKLGSAEQLLQFQTSIYRDLPLPENKYPLIIYAAGMNGSTWENAGLFDSLCKHGYVVAAVSSVGLFPGYMSSGPDITEQVNDILFTEKKIAEMPFIDRARIGLLSWSLGGTAITKAAMVNSNFKCLLSYDGTEIHRYGAEKDWDKIFDEMIALQPADPSAIKVPFMYLSSRGKKVSNTYNIMDHIASKEKFFVKIDDGKHEDFSTVTDIAAKIKHSQKELTKKKKIWDLTRIFFDQYLKGSPGASVKQYLSAVK